MYYMPDRYTNGWPEWVQTVATSIQAWHAFGLREFTLTAHGYGVRDPNESVYDELVAELGRRGIQDVHFIPGLGPQTFFLGEYQSPPSPCQNLWCGWHDVYPLGAQRWADFGQAVRTWLWKTNEAVHAPPRFFIDAEWVLRTDSVPRYGHWYRGRTLPPCCPVGDPYNYEPALMAAWMEHWTLHARMEFYAHLGLATDVEIWWYPAVIGRNGRAEVAYDFRLMWALCRSWRNAARLLSTDPLMVDVSFGYQGSTYPEPSQPRHWEERRAIARVYDDRASNDPNLGDLKDADLNLYKAVPVLWWDPDPRDPNNGYVWGWPVVDAVNVTDHIAAFPGYHPAVLLDIESTSSTIDTTLGIIASFTQCKADMDCNGLVDFNDAVLLDEARRGDSKRWSEEHGCSYYNGDLNCDGRITLADITLFAEYLGRRCGS